MRFWPGKTLVQTLAISGVAITQAACAATGSPTAASPTNSAPAVAESVASADQIWLNQILEEAVETHNVPAMAAVVLLPNDQIIEAAAGVRRAGGNDAATTEDYWHIGSLTKSITATIVARLAEREILSLDMTMAQVYPEEAASWSEATRGVTIRQLMTMSSGLRDDTLDETRLVAWTQADGDLLARRQAAALDVLEEGVQETPGETFAYANGGYVVLGAVVESLLDRSWEDIVAEHFYDVLGITNAGFGAPGASDPQSQPWGHEIEDGSLIPVDPMRPDADNPPEIAAAGTMHFRLSEWAKFARDHLRGEDGSGAMMGHEMFRAAHRPAVGSPGYGFGWGVREGDDGQRMLSHSGSNDIWYAYTRLALGRDSGFLIVTNVAGDPAEDALRAVTQALSARYLTEE